MKPLDLRSTAPRSCYAMLDGLMLLPRTIDKARSMLPGGHPGNYVMNLADGVRGISGFLLQRLGISEAAFIEAVETAETDDDVALWLRERANPELYPRFNETLKRIRPAHTDDERLFREIYAATLDAHPDLEFVIDIVEADDRRQLEPR